MNWGLLFQGGIPSWELVVRALAIYIAMLVMLRVFGKREVGQFTLYDLVLVLLVANAVQPAITGPDSTLSGGFIIIAVLVLFNFLVAQLDARIGIFHRLLEPHPTVIISDGQYREQAMRREQVDSDEVAAAIREHGLESVGDVKLGVLEPDGTISIVPKDSDVFHSKRRVRRRTLRV